MQGQETDVKEKWSFRVFSCKTIGFIITKQANYVGSTSFQRLCTGANVLKVTPVGLDGSQG